MGGKKRKNEREEKKECRGRERNGDKVNTEIEKMRETERERNIEKEKKETER